MLRFTSKGFPLAWRHLPVHRDINTNPGSDESLTLAETYLSHYLEKHKLCKQVLSLLPKRILDVGQSPDTIKLVEVELNTTGHYVALSYCWGTA